MLVVLAQRDPQVVDAFFAERAVRVTGALFVVLEKGSVGHKVPIASSAKVVVAGLPFVLQKRLVAAKPARAAVAICHGARDEIERREGTREAGSVETAVATPGRTLARAARQLISENRENRCYKPTTL